MVWTSGVLPTLPAMMTRFCIWRFLSFAGIIPSTEPRPSWPSRCFHRGAQTRRETPIAGVVRAAASAATRSERLRVGMADGQIRGFSEGEGMVTRWVARGTVRNLQHRGVQTCAHVRHDQNRSPPSIVSSQREPQMERFRLNRRRQDTVPPGKAFRGEASALHT